MSIPSPPVELQGTADEAHAGMLPGIEAHPHARAVLLPALASHGHPSHAYLFHGPAGTGKRAVARAFAAALLVQGARNPATVAERVARDSHPDLTWVTPSGSAEMLVRSSPRGAYS
jgi:DNA polymerase-3 subunit delta'